MKVYQLENDNRKIVKSAGPFHVLEYQKDLSVSPYTATAEYFMSQMNVHRRQVIANLNGSGAIILQAGAMQWMSGSIQMQSGVKGVGDFFGKMVSSAVTKETVAKPVYTGAGIVALEPTYKYLLLEDIGKWPGGITLEDGMFLACEGSVRNQVVSRSNASSALLGGEGFFNLSLSGQGFAVLESNVPEEELIAIDLQNDELRIDGSLAVCWSTGLSFTVERSARSLMGSAVSGEGLVNVYRGTGRILMAPVTPTRNLAASTNTTQAKPAGTTSNTIFESFFN